MKLAICILVILGCASAQFSADGRKAILKAHNKMRSALSKGTYSVNGIRKPAAANMRKLKWDESLEASAQNYSAECPQPDVVRPLGHNVYSYLSMVNLNTTLDEYEREFYYDGCNSTKTDENIINSRIRKAIQMVYADSSKIGCGVKDCGRTPSMDNWFMVLVVCRYEKPVSNVVSDIYLEGEACSKCSEGSKCETSSGLCA